MVFGHYFFTTDYRAFIREDYDWKKHRTVFFLLFCCCYYYILVCIIAGLMSQLCVNFHLNIDE